MVLVKVNIAPSPEVDIPVIALLTKTVPIPSPITVVPAATVEFPPVTVTTSPSAMFESIPLPAVVVVIPVIEISKPVESSITPAVVPIPTLLDVYVVTLVDDKNLSSS